MLPFVLLICLIWSVGSVHNPLGPGSSTVWETTRAEEVGLSTDALVAASAALERVGTHLCLSVVKDGALIVDDYYDGPFMQGRERLVEGMSAAKAVTAALIGSAVQRGLFDIDTPISEYGVVASAGANWSRNPNRTDYFPYVTARHLLSQTTGVGEFMPGTAFTYDSDEYIQHLSFLLSATVGGNRTAREWATSEFAVPLGIPNLYSHEGPDPAGRGDTPLPNEGGEDAISAGGDQPLLCRDLARVGLLLLNEGTWASEDAQGREGEMQLVDPEYAKAMFRPQSTSIPPNVGLSPGRMTSQYSFLAEVATDNSDLVNKSACNDRNGGMVKILGLPDNSLTALGLIGKYLIIVPEEKLVIVAFGSNFGKLSCEHGTQGTWVNEENVVLSEIWRAIGPALMNRSSDAGRSLHQAHVEAAQTASSESVGHELKASPNGAASLDQPKGSCYCYCGYSQAIGRCFNTTASAQQCQQMKNSTETADTISAFCPKTSLLLDCFNLSASSRQCPPTLEGMEMQLDVDRKFKDCPTEAPPGPLMQTMQCHYKPVTYDTCIWSPSESCVDSPFFPLADDVSSWTPAAFSV